MTPQQFKKARKDLGLTAQQMAAALQMGGGDTAGRSIRRWEAGDARILGPAAVAIRYMTTHGLDRPARKAAGL